MSSGWIEIDGGGVEAMMIFLQTLKLFSFEILPILQINLQKKKEN